MDNLQLEQLGMAARIPRVFHNRSSEQHLRFFLFVARVTNHGYLTSTFRLFQICFSKLQSKNIGLCTTACTVRSSNTIHNAFILNFTDIFDQYFFYCVFPLRIFIAPRRTRVLSSFDSVTCLLSKFQQFFFIVSNFLGLHLPAKTIVRSHLIFSSSFTATSVFTTTSLAVYNRQDIKMIPQTNSTAPTTPSQSKRPSLLESPTSDKSLIWPSPSSTNSLIEDMDLSLPTRAPSLPLPPSPLPGLPEAGSFSRLPQPLPSGPSGMMLPSPPVLPPPPSPLHKRTAGGTATSTGSTPAVVGTPPPPARASVGASSTAGQLPPRWRA